MTQVSSLKSSVLSHFIPMGTGGQGIDLAAINLHCSVIAILPAYFDRKLFWQNWQFCAERQIKILGIGRRVCSWTNKINPVSVFMLRVYVTASSRLQTPLSLTKTSRTSRFSQYPFSLKLDTMQCYQSLPSRKHHVCWDLVNIPPFLPLFKRFESRWTALIVISLCLPKNIT